MLSIDGTLLVEEPDFRKISQFPKANYCVTQPWDHLERWIQRETEDLKLNLNPDFQRAHVWSREQQSAYVEYQLRGGTSGRDLYFNHPGWMADWHGEFVIVDGKQRLEAVRAFLRDEVLAFGFRCSQFKHRLGASGPYFQVHVANLQTRADLLRWYLAINTGGTPHSTVEIAKVRKMLKVEMVTP